MSIISQSCDEASIPFLSSTASWFKRIAIMIENAFLEYVTAQTDPILSYSDSRDSRISKILLVMHPPLSAEKPIKSAAHFQV